MAECRGKEEQGASSEATSAAAEERARVNRKEEDCDCIEQDEAEIVRVEAGLPEYGRDLDEDRMPAEAGLDDAVSFSKGCYLGQEVVVRLRDRGHLNRKLCGLRFESTAIPAVGSKLRSADRPQAAVLTSVVSSPRFGVIGLGYVHRSSWELGTRLELLGASDEPTGQSATVVALPFSG